MPPWGALRKQGGSRKPSPPDPREKVADHQARDADELDGFDSTDFLGASAKAADAETLDGFDSTTFQARVTGACSAGSSIRAVLADGTVTCQVDADSGAVVYTSTGSGTIGASPAPIATTTVPAGNYLVIASLIARNNDATGHAPLFCGINSAPFEEMIDSFVAGEDYWEQVNLQRTVTLGATGSIDVLCYNNVGGSQTVTAQDVQMFVIPVEQIIAP